MKRIAKITVALLLAVAMCFSLAGCYDEDLNWSAKYDGTELPAHTFTTSPLRTTKRPPRSLPKTRS